MSTTEPAAASVPWVYAVDTLKGVVTGPSATTDRGTASVGLAGEGQMGATHTRSACVTVYHVLYVLVRVPEAVTTCDQSGWVVYTKVRAIAAGQSTNMNGRPFSGRALVKSRRDLGWPLSTGPDKSAHLSCLERYNHRP